MLPNPWLILGIVLAWIASLGAVGYWQNNAGHVAERVGWQAKDNKELASANAKILALEEAARTAEAAHAAEMSLIGDQDAKDREALEAQRRRDVAAARDGALRLRVAHACPIRPDRSASAAPPAAAAGGDDSTTGELPGAITADLLDLAHDADGNTEQLTACQAVVSAYYKACGPKP